MLLQIKKNTISGKKKNNHHTNTGKNKHYYRKKNPKTAWCISVAFDNAKMAYSFHFCGLSIT